MKLYYLLLLLIGLPGIGRASAYWMDTKGSGKAHQPVQIQICYGYIDESGIRHRDTGRELDLIADFKISFIDNHGQRTNMPIKQNGDCWEGTFVPKENGVYRIIGINDKHPVVDRSKTGGINVRPIDYLCAAYHVDSDSSAIKPVQYLDIATQSKGKLITVKAFHDGLPTAKGSKIRIFNPENWEKELALDEKSEAVFMPTMKGLYIIRQDWVAPTSGTYQGVAYANIRYRCNYCLQIQ
jgi:hypothetical protein